MTILSDNEIIYYLEKLRDTLKNYDFSSVSNLLFYDIESFTLYIENNKDNPFSNQYKEIERILTYISPYINVNIPEDTLELFMEMDYPKDEKKNILLKNIRLSLMIDFLDTVKEIESPKDWNRLVTECINNKKELKLKQLTN